MISCRSFPDVSRKSLTIILRFSGTLAGECDYPCWDCDDECSEEYGMAYHVSHVESIFKHDGL